MIIFPPLVPSFLHGDNVESNRSSLYIREMIELRHRKVVVVVMQLRRRTLCVNDALRESSGDISFACTSLEMGTVAKVGRAGTKHLRQWPISAA
jgi:hypothetical protein